MDKLSRFQKCDKLLYVELSKVNFLRADLLRSSGRFVFRLCHDACARSKIEELPPCDDELGFWKKGRKILSRTKARHLSKNQSIVLV